MALTERRYNMVGLTPYFKSKRAGCRFFDSSSKLAFAMGAH